MLLSRNICKKSQYATSCVEMSLLLYHSDYSRNFYIFFSDCNCSSNELLELGNNGGYHEGFSALNTPSDGSPRNSNIEIKGEPLKTLLSVSSKNFQIVNKQLQKM